MNPWIPGVGGLVVGLALGVGVYAIIVPERASESKSLAEQSDARRPTLSGVVRLVCDLELDAGKDVLGITASEATRIASVGLDFDRNSGWYDGTLAISESRPGTLTIDGDVLMVKRPALFQRFGARIVAEEFSINRQSGIFQQHLTIDTGFQIPLIKGRCARLVKPPF